MGLEAATVGYIVAAVGAAATAYGTMEQQKASKRQSRAQKEAKDISLAQQKAEQIEKQRQEIRQRRIRVAQVQQAAANSSVSGSSGELGAIGSIQTTSGNNIAFGESAALAARGITAQNQVASDANMSAQLNQGIAGLGFSALSMGANMGAFNGLFSDPAPNVNKQVDNMISSNPSLF